MILLLCDNYPPSMHKNKCVLWPYCHLVWILHHYWTHHRGCCSAADFLQRRKIRFLNLMYKCTGTEVFCMISGGSARIVFSGKRLYIILLPHHNLSKLSLQREARWNSKRSRSKIKSLNRFHCFCCKRPSLLAS